VRVVLAQASSAIRRKMRKVAGSGVASTTSIFHRIFPTILLLRPAIGRRGKNPFDIPSDRQETLRRPG
jgi:hypothetical protein